MELSRSRSSLIGVDFEDFGSTYGFQILPVGGRATILVVKVPAGMVGFIEAVATNWPSGDQSTWQEWFIDGARHGDRIFTPIGELLAVSPAGTLPEPRKFSPPIVFKYSTEFIGQNNNPAPQLFQATCRGSFYQKPRMKE